MKHRTVTTSARFHYGRSKLACIALVLLATLLAAVPSGVLPSPGLAPRASAATAHTASFTLDSVSVTLTLDAELPPHLGVAAPGNASQVASFSGGNPFRELAITAVPFGTKPGTEQLPAARTDGSAAYYAALREYRIGQGAQPVNGPTADIFGVAVAGLVSRVALPLHGAALNPTVIVEWVAEAGNRLWIVRATDEQAPGVELPRWLTDLRISSTNLSSPTTVAGAASVPQVGAAKSNGAADEQRPVDDLPYPAWWNGSDCDYDRYFSGSGGRGSYRLGRAVPWYVRLRTAPRRRWCARRACALLPRLVGRIRL